MVVLFSLVFMPSCQKHQAPSSKLQRSSKSQTPNLKMRCRDKRRAGRFLSLELDASLELGDWELGAFYWAVSLSKVEMHAAGFLLVLKRDRKSTRLNSSHPSISY